MGCNSSLQGRRQDRVGPGQLPPLFPLVSIETPIHRPVAAPLQKGGHPRPNMADFTGHPSFVAIAKMLDHSVLLPSATQEEVVKQCALARERGVASVCVKPCDVASARIALAGSSVAVCTVIGFPHGTSTTQTKVAEAREAVLNGATELDMVLNVGRLKGGDAAFVQGDIAAVVAVANELSNAAKGRVLVKVILEVALLTDSEKVAACRLAADAGAHFVKTSTGFAASGSTPRDLRLMREAAPAHVALKAAGGVRTLATVLEARACGATRCGATATVAILDELCTALAAGTFTLGPVGGGLLSTAVAVPDPSPAADAPGTAY